MPISMQAGEGNYSYGQRRAEGLGIVLIDKPDVDTLLIPAVRAALDL